MQFPVDYRPSSRQLFGILALAGAAGVAFALYMQHIVGLNPCPLCIFQRASLIVFTVICALAAVSPQGPVLSRLWALAAMLAALAGAAIAGRHVWIQHLPPDLVPACGPGLDYWMKTFPLQEVIQKVLHGSGECAVIDWTLAGLSMPNWTLLMFSVLALCCMPTLLHPRLAPTPVQIKY